MNRLDSEASYSRMITSISESDAFETGQERLLLQAISEEFVSDETIAIDATHVESCDRAPFKTEKVEKEPKKRGRKKKEEREQWLLEKAEKEKIFHSMKKQSRTNLMYHLRNFAPTCVREHSFRYDSYDAKYKTLKYTQPNECKDRPLDNDSLCQMVYKKKVTDDIRRYTLPARGSVKWDKICNSRHHGEHEKRGC